MLLEPVVTQLQAGGFLKSVLEAVDFAAAQQNPPQILPAGYVVPMRDNAGPNRLLSGAVEQRVDETFGIILAIRNVRDARGASAKEDLASVRSGVIGSLLGWAPGAGYDPVEYAGGTILQFANQVLWWQLGFRTAYYERSV